MSKPRYQVTAAVILREGKVLVTRRPPGAHLAGFWEFPGGKKENGESLEECLGREIREELGVGIHLERHLLTREHEYETKHVTLHFYLCAVEGQGEPRAREGQEIRWASQEELASLRFPPPDQGVLDALRQGRGLI